MKKCRQRRKRKHDLVEAQKRLVQLQREQGERLEESQQLLRQTETIYSTEKR